MILTAAVRLLSLMVLDILVESTIVSLPSPTIPCMLFPQAQRFLFSLVVTYVFPRE